MEAWRWEKSLDCMSIRESYLRDPQLHLCLQIVPTAVPHDLLQAAKQRHSLAGCQTDTLSCRLSNKHPLYTLSCRLSKKLARCISGCDTDTLSCRLSNRQHLFQAVTQTPSFSGCHTDTLYCRLSHRLGLLQTLKQIRSIAGSQRDTASCRLSQRRRRRRRRTVSYTHLTLPTSSTV